MPRGKQPSNHHFSGAMFNFRGVPHLIGSLKPPNGKNINAHRNLEMLPRMLQRKWDIKPSRPTLPTQNLFFGKSRITPKMRPGGLLPFRIAHPLSSSDHPLSEASSLSQWGGKDCASHEVLQLCGKIGAQKSNLCRWAQG